MAQQNLTYTPGTPGSGEKGFTAVPKIQANFTELYGRTGPELIGIDIRSIGVLTTNTATQNKTNLLAWLAQSPIAKIREDFGSRLKLIVPAQDTFTPIDGEIDFDGTIAIEGATASSLLGISACSIKFANGRYGFRFRD